MSFPFAPSTTLGSTHRLKKFKNLTELTDHVFVFAGYALSYDITAVGGHVKWNTDKSLTVPLSHALPILREHIIGAHTFDRRRYHVTGVDHMAYNYDMAQDRGTYNSLDVFVRIDDIAYTVSLRLYRDGSSLVKCFWSGSVPEIDISSPIAVFLQTLLAGAIGAFPAATSGAETAVGAIAGRATETLGGGN